jgi:5-(aminomethyl)-3-furanmethanol phosphate kinase
MATLAVVVKVSGSLFDLPDLGLRLRRCLDELGTRDVLLIPGGGITADAVRQLDRWQKLGEEHSHWLALRAMTLNAGFLAALLSNGVVIKELNEYRDALTEGKAPILDAYAFCREDERRPGCLPHTWAVTSDAVAARVAAVAGARQLLLLKSVPLPEGIDWVEAGHRGLIDRYCGDLLGQLPLTEVRWVHFREVGEQSSETSRRTATGSKVP